ncbi:MAG: tetratricopeptide repeat protein [Clostridioides sp.]|jgi:tetratricopeptide (TPR) repeat protein|nr:tetratricopeptide repeat protein [Clostridioides sp.]
MKFRIEKYFFDLAEELAFINIKNDGEFILQGYELKEGLEVPIKNSVLVKGIKNRTAQDELNIMSIADAMIYMIGIDSNFVYNEEYIKFLQAFSKKVNLNIRDYAGYMSRKNFEEGSLREALVYIKSLITIYENDVDALYNYAVICQELALGYKADKNEKAFNNFLLEAVEKLEEILKIDEDYESAYYQLGFHYMNQNQFIKAKLAWQKALEMGVDDEIHSEIQDNLMKIHKKVQYEEGCNLIFQGNPQQALEKLLPLESEYPDWWNLLFMIGLSYRYLNQLDEAMRYFEKILMLYPKQVDTMSEMGLIYALKGQFEKSIEIFSNALKIKEDPEILCNLGMVYLNNGELDEAKYYIERAYELNPDDEVTISCLNEIQKYMS